MERKLCELLDHEVGAVEAERSRHSIGTATVKIPAAFAAFTPFGESSKAIAIVTADMRRTSPAASVLQASGFRSDVTVFRLNASVAGQSGSESAFRRNTAERVYTIEAAHNPEVAGSDPAPATRKAPETGPFCSLSRMRSAKLLPNFCPERAAWQKGGGAAHRGRRREREGRLSGPVV